MPLEGLSAAKRWVGLAQNVPRIYTLTFAGTWVQGDLASLICNGKTLEITVGTAVTVTDIAAAFTAAFNGLPLIYDESRNTTGLAIGEFYQCSASYSAGVVTITGRPGRPLTCTNAKTSTSGTATLTSVQTPTGANWATNADNYSDGVALTTGDSLVLTDSSVDILYGLEAFEELDQLDQYASFTGKIGLPDVNTQNASYPFKEYSSLYAPLDKGSVVYNVGMGVGLGSPRTRIDFAAEDAVVTVYSTGRSDGTTTAPLELRDIQTAGSIVTVRKGTVLILGADTLDLVIGYTLEARKATDAFVTVVGGSLDVVTITGGTLTLYDCAVTSATAYDGQIVANGTTAFTTITVGNAMVTDRATGTVGTLTLNGSGGWDSSQHASSKTLTNPVQVYDDRAIFRDPQGTFGNVVVNLNQVGLPAGLEIVRNKKITLGAI